MRGVVSIALALGVAGCAAAPRPMPRAIAAPPPAAVAPEDQRENPAPEWIVGDWSALDRPRRSLLLTYAHDAAAWKERCRREYAITKTAVDEIAEDLDRDDVIPSGASPYDALPIFHEASLRFAARFDRVVKERSLDEWETSFFFRPVNDQLRAALHEWERATAPEIEGALWVWPLGRGFSWITETADETSYCQHARTAGTRSVPKLEVPPKLAGLVALPFPGEITPTKLPPAEGAAPWYQLDGKIASVKSSSEGTVVRVVETQETVEEAPPCHVEQCSGRDCNMDGRHGLRTVCSEITVKHQFAYEAVFAELPRDVTLERSDNISCVVNQPLDEEATHHAPYRAVLLLTVEGWDGKPVFNLEREPPRPGWRWLLGDP